MPETLTNPCLSARRAHLRTGTWSRGRWGLIVGLWLTGCSIGLLSAQSKPSGEIMRFGFSQSMFGGVNTNDAQAAMMVWADTIASERGIAVSPSVLFLDDVPAIARALDDHRVEAVTVTVAEYWEIRQSKLIGPLIMGAADEDLEEEYLLLVNIDGTVKSLADLKGRSLSVWQSARTGIGETWLEVQVLENNLGNPASFWGTVNRHTKLSQVVLPVFFGQVAACLVTRKGFEVLQELNPQLGRKLVPIARSPAYIPSLFFFRGDFHSPNLPRMIEVFVDVGNAPAGQQTLTLFQQTNLMEGKPADLDVTCALLDRHYELTTGSKPPPPFAGDTP
ncbi:PhnD/SsuA/transferrin family substrate-binding protein [Synoicihabitans lomoniglobus]|uniref:PhnD/SsuA/transferrin family substrate-binding protein n=1 Tax=Synoicihabitans lomoniglobus TaxID=2909285 RepID=A0AAE9ZUG6_9BACT|nr:phosphate/phosphite/phosphonate ABC transporter substrate-binding protein [Opitutaceae bacterium LMO-M01]WED63264.1 PhnD/SsuA/transferrin family substrate-binding protein [Opitutaceae bacterium LMO-M01]